MSNTGYKIITYRDTNPYSPTYLQTKTERVLDISACPNDSPDWIEIDRECNKIIYNPSGTQGNDGTVTITYQDQNIDSPTYMQTKEVVNADLSNCPLPNKNPDWKLQESYCEQG